MYRIEKLFFRPVIVLFGKCFGQLMVYSAFCLRRQKVICRSISVELRCKQLIGFAFCFARILFVICFLLCIVRICIGNTFPIFLCILLTFLRECAFAFDQAEITPFLDACSRFAVVDSVFCRKCIDERAFFCSKRHITLLGYDRADTHITVILRKRYIAFCSCVDTCRHTVCDKRRLSAVYDKVDRTAAREINTIAADNAAAV